MKILTPNQAQFILELGTTRLANYAIENDLKGFVNGVSGGADSTVVVMFALKAAKILREMGKRDFIVRNAFIGIDSDPFDLKRARALGEAWKFDLEEIDLTHDYHTSQWYQRISPNHPKASVRRGNIKCRMRMITLSDIAAEISGIYLDTDDMSEELMGFWTIRGDCGDLKIIQHLTKTEVYDLAEYFTAPKIILESKPGDGLKVTTANTASSQLGDLDYAVIDYIMSRFFQIEFDVNGSLDQLYSALIKRHIVAVAKEIGKPTEKVTTILRQALKTAYKRKHGDNVCHLLPSRTELELPEYGTTEFNRIYLATIKKYGY